MHVNVINKSNMQGSLYLQNHRHLKSHLLQQLLEWRTPDIKWRFFQLLMIPNQSKQTSRAECGRILVLLAADIFSLISLFTLPLFHQGKCLDIYESPWMKTIDIYRNIFFQLQKKHNQTLCTFSNIPSSWFLKFYIPWFHSIWRNIT
jgi:hypothetical protein